MHSNRSGMRMRLFGVLLVLALVALPLENASAAVVRYAKPTGVNKGKCTSWATACTLQRALTVAVAGNQVWVAMGTHKPNTKNDFDRTKTFSLKNGVAVYGGFLGNETSVTQRNFVTNVTVLSGDIHIKGDSSDNSFHVVTANGVNSTAKLDGFTIKAGNANGDLLFGSEPSGGGMINTSSSPTLRNLVFKANLAALRGAGMYNLFSNPNLANVRFTANVVANLPSAIGGGGIYNNTSSPTLTKVTFNSNNGSHEGGGMVNANGSNPVLNKVTFSRNSADQGGGMSNNFSNPSLTNVTFTGNISTGSGQGGGGMYNNGSEPTLNNVTFTGNTTPGNGGGIYNNNGSDPTIVNVTISGNRTTGIGQGGGMANQSSNPILNNVTFSGNSTATAGSGDAMFNADSAPQIYNTILWGDGPGTSEVVDVTSVVTIMDSVVQNAVAAGATAIDCLADGQSTCVHVLNTSPALGLLKDNGGFTLTRAVGPSGSAVDKGGVNFACAAKDQRGVVRPQRKACDIGAYELK